MKFAKFSALATAAALSLGVFADAGNLLISFSTPGPDKYADGVTVLDGEWYALVWSQNGVFEGLTPDCEPVDANDRVVIVAPLAKAGRCPFTVFQIDSASPNCKASGVYSVYLLDTRSADKTSVAARVNGKPASVNGAVASESFSAAASTSSSGVVSKGSAGGSVWAASEIAGEVKQPKITAFKVEGAQVKITVEELLPSVKYNVQMGATPSALETYALEIPKTGAATADFTISAGDAKFFKVVREPLVKEVK